MSIVDEAYARYRSRIDTRKAMHEDPQFKAETHWLRNTLAMMDMAMEDEGIPEHSRERIIRTVLYGGPDPIDAERRIDLKQQMAEMISPSSSGWPPKVYP